MRSTSTTIVLGLLAVLAAGCGARPEPVGSLPDTRLAVVDGIGATISLRAGAHHVASSDPAATATLQALGVTVTTFPAGGSPPAGADLAITSAARGTQGDPTDLPVFHWGVGNLRDAGFQVAQIALAVSRGGEGVALAHTIDGAVATSLARARSEPSTTVLVEGYPLQAAARDDPVAAVVVQLGGTLVAPPGTSVPFAQIRRLAPAAWIAVEPASTTLATVRLAVQLRKVPAVRDGRVLHLLRSDLEPSPTLGATLAAIVHVLHPAA